MATITKTGLEELIDWLDPIHDSVKQKAIELSKKENETAEQVIEENRADWFKAGGMAERILIDWEMKQLKSKLNDVTTDYRKSVLRCDGLQQENSELKLRCKALEERISLLVNNTTHA